MHEHRHTIPANTMKPCPVPNCARWIDRKHEMCWGHWHKLKAYMQSDLIRSRRAWEAGSLSKDVYLENLNAACAVASR